MISRTDGLLYGLDREPFLDVIRMHRDSVKGIDSKRVPPAMYRAAEECWVNAYELGKRAGFRIRHADEVDLGNLADQFANPLGQHRGILDQQQFYLLNRHGPSKQAVSAGPCQVNLTINVKSAILS